MAILPLPVVMIVSIKHSAACWDATTWQLMFASPPIHSAYAIAENWCPFCEHCFFSATPTIGWQNWVRQASPVGPSILSARFSMTLRFRHEALCGSVITPLLGLFACQAHQYTCQRHLHACIRPHPCWARTMMRCCSAQGKFYCRFRRLTSCLLWTLQPTAAKSTANNSLG